MPLFAVVRAKRRSLVITRLSAFQGLSGFPIVAESNSPKCNFFLELVPNRNEVSPPHGDASCRYVRTPAFGRLSFSVETQARPLRFRRRSAAANHDFGR